MISKYFHLILSEYVRKPTRTFLTFLSIAVAFLLFGLFHGINASFYYTLDWLSEDSLRVLSKSGLRQPLPLSHLNKIEKLNGVRIVEWAAVFPCYFQDPKQIVSGAAIAPDRLKAFPHLQIAETQYQNFVQTRTGAVVGRKLMDKFGWRLGEKVALHSNVWSTPRNGGVLIFDIVGIWDMDGNKDLANEFYIQYEYLDESRRPDVAGTASLFIVRTSNSKIAPQVAREIDSMFANSGDETLTQSDKEWVGAAGRQVSQMYSLVNWILIAALLTVLILTRNTISESLRERRVSFGTLVALGFGRGKICSLIVAESVLLCIAGSLAGLLAAWLLFPHFAKLVGLTFSFLPPGAIIFGIAMSVLVGISGSLPQALSMSTSRAAQLLSAY